MALINLRNALMAGKRLPYDAEVEYLESTGTQYIDTGVIATENTRVKATLMTLSTGNKNWFGGQVIFVGRNAGFIFNSYSSNSIEYLFGNGDWKVIRVSNIVGRVFTFDFSKDGVVIDGITVATPSYTIFPQQSTSFKIFVRNGGSGYINGRLYAFQIYQNGVLVRDYIPVRKGTVGYLYDRVSGKLFGNAGTGDFVVGPDVVPVEYLESTGTEWQWINALDSAQDADSFEMSVAMLTDNSNRRIFFGSGGGDKQYLEVTAATKWGAGLSSGVACQIGAATTIAVGTDRLLQINGTNAIQGLNLVGSTAPDFPLCLFKTRGYNGYICAVRCFYFKAWQSSVLVRSFHPVRVGTEGAMIDTLTRRIYRNAGTGAFTYGNDLKYPIPAS